jgi:hypothetical protein
LCGHELKKKERESKANEATVCSGCRGTPPADGLFSYLDDAAICLIFEAIAREGELNDLRRMQDLVSLCVTCRRLRAVAQSEMARRLVWPIFNSSEVVASDSRSHPDFGTFLGGVAFGCATHIRSVNLVHTIAVELARASAATLTELTVYEIGSALDTEVAYILGGMDAVLDCALRLPALRKLELSVLNGGFDRPPSGITCPHLEHLNIREVVGSTNILAGNSFPRLRSIVLRGQRNDTAVEMIQACSGTIEELALVDIAGRASDTTDRLGAAIRGAKNLRALSLCYPNIASMDFGPGGVPRNLESLSIDVVRSQVVRINFRGLLESGCPLKNLSVVGTVANGRVIAKISEFRRLESLCQDLGPPGFDPGATLHKNAEIAAALTKFGQDAEAQPLSSLELRHSAINPHFVLAGPRFAKLHTLKFVEYWGPPAWEFPPALAESLRVFVCELTTCPIAAALYGCRNLETLCQGIRAMAVLRDIDLSKVVASPIHVTLIAPYGDWLSMPLDLLRTPFGKRMQTLDIRHLDAGHAQAMRAAGDVVKCCPLVHTIVIGMRESPSTICGNHERYRSPRGSRPVEIRLV